MESVLPCEHCEQRAWDWCENCGQWLCPCCWVNAEHRACEIPAHVEIALAVHGAISLALHVKFQIAWIDASCAAMLADSVPGWIHQLRQTTLSHWTRGSRERLFSEAMSVSRFFRHLASALRRYHRSKTGELC